ncbi:MAG: SMP-30/gluconolactonase/LRE family protein [Verrucomicrobia bacterium]|jgi:gluconolactonase|nr:SMP-30/gluconolactonase/LRE family protein [Verrucomicrobiota bacterium]OQC64326.1 MAG: Gluconolactonase precursor [Verrucomicrobia bacterium ADurb.Bin006]MDI9382583.1 SMP-30/gluconolactonase/LRE family protein [Verrucomicrobiota bacterium]NMD21227.1 SMP-30/gluconolactonase/LRE family protein [Verrucomicrobiota bacterium]HOA62310.1 SMP-30/gluconolactonase/LRE family protein [Verrucomicrobiota bacterium]
MNATFPALTVVCFGLVLSAASLAAEASWPKEVPASSPRKSKKIEPASKVYPSVGAIERHDVSIDTLISPDAKVERLAGGFEWAEGPVWNRKTRTLLFSDVPRNVIFEWKESVGTRDYLYRSGYTGARNEGKEPGSNGLTFDADGRLVICMHGDRVVARLERDGKLTILADYYLNRRFNSPNDLVYNSKGNLYFTDPPYGLAKLNDDPNKDLMFNGVFLRRRTGEVVLLTRELTFPNGVALSPDEKTLYVAVSDPARPVIMSYPLKDDGTLEAGTVFFDASSLTGRAGLPDGLKVDIAGNLFATGPGGVLVLAPDARHLGTIVTGEPVANCAWGDDGSTLYLTSGTSLCRVKTLTKGRMP